MNSFLTEYLNSKSNQLSIVIHNKLEFIRPLHIITFSLILNACGLMNLLNNKFIIFVFLFITSYYALLFNKIYADKYNYSSIKVNYFHNVAEWIIIISMYMIISNLFKYKINIYIIIVFVIILILCNLNYILNKYNEKNACIELWDKCIKTFIHKDAIDAIKNITIYFDETLTVLYLLIIITYLYFKN